MGTVVDNSWLEFAKQKLPIAVHVHRSYIGKDQAEELRCYMRGGGGARGESSTFGAQLEKAALYAHHTVACDACGGVGYVAATKSEPTETQLMMLEWLQIHASELPPEIDATCPDCKGCGYKVVHSGNHAKGVITARPTGSSVRSRLAGSYCPDAADLIVGSRLSSVGKLHQLSRSALEHYYAPDGNSMVALWHLTPSGQTLLKQCGKVANLRHREAFANLIDEHSRNPTGNRKAQFTACDDQARELLHLARRIWNHVAGERSELEADGAE